MARINTAHLPNNLRERVTDAIYSEILAGADVRDAIIRVAVAAESDALRAGWAPVMARFMRQVVNTVGGELLADMVRNLAAAN